MVSLSNVLAFVVFLSIYGSVSHPIAGNFGHVDSLCGTLDSTIFSSLSLPFHIPEQK